MRAAIRADSHYHVVRATSGARRDQITHLRCMHCPYTVNVLALHRAGDLSGAGRYCRARAKMVAHWHATHMFAYG